MHVYPLTPYLTKDYFTLREDMDVKEAMSSIIYESSDESLIDYLYVIDKKQKLSGVLPLKNLIIARSPNKIEAIMAKKYHFLEEDAPIYMAIDKIQQYDLEMIPVLDKHGNIKGIFTAEMALDLLKEESLEQYRNLASITEGSIETNFYNKARSRLPWLIVLLILSVFTTTILSRFEATIQQVVVLAYFQTMILDMGGNVSTQSLASLVIKMSKDPDAKLKKHIIRELLIGAINSVFSALFGFVVSFIFLYILKSDNALQISSIISVTLLISLLVAAVTGTMIPVMFKKLKVDPSVASGPFMTTINDIFSLLVYLGLATLLLL